MKNCLLFLILLGSAWWDKRTGKISNKWLFLGAVCYLALCLIRAPALGGLKEGEGFFGELAALFFIKTTLFVIISFPLFLFRMMGAGDIKLMALLFGSMGGYDGILVIFYGLAASAIWSLFFMIKNHIFLKRIKYFIEYFRLFFQTGLRVPYYLPGRDQGRVSFSFAPFLLGGFCLWLTI